MDGYRASVFLHLFATVLIVGQALFWAIMYYALKQQFNEAQTGGYLVVLQKARWPHVAVPYSLRLPLPVMGWATIALLVATGAAIIATNALPTNALWWTKMALLGVLVVIQLLLSRRMGAGLIFANLLVVLALAIASALMVRG